MEFEKGIQDLANANFSQIRKFIDTLTDMIGKKSSGNPIKNDLVYILFFMEKMLPDMILKKQTFYITPHANEIMEQDAQFFLDRPQIFGQLPADKVNVFRDVYVESNLTDDEKNEIWSHLKAFLIMSGIYRGKYFSEVVENFSNEMKTFFQVLRTYSSDRGKELLEQVETTFNDEQENYAPEVALICVACQLIPNTKKIEERDVSFFQDSSFLVRDDIPRNWLQQILPAQLSQEAKDYIWGYLLSIKGIAEQFVEEPERFMKKQ